MPRPATESAPGAALLAIAIAAAFGEACRAPAAGGSKEAGVSATGAMQEPRLALVPLIAEIRTDFGQPAHAELVPVGSLARQATLSIEKVEGAEVSAAVIANPGGGPASVVLTTEAKVVGSSTGRIFLATGLSDPREVVASYLVRVAGNLSVSPEAPYVDLRAPGPQSVILNVKSRRPDFRLSAAEVTAGPFEASVGSQESTGAFMVQVRAIGERMNVAERGVLAKIVLVSNDPAEPRKEVTVFALGDPAAASDR